MAATYSEIARLRAPIQIHAALRRKLHLSPALADLVVGSLKLARNPSDAARRIRLARAAGLAALPGPIEERSGSLVLAPGRLPGQAAAIAAADGAFREFERTSSVADARTAANKSFLVTLLRQTQFLSHPEIFRFAISRPLLDLSAAYLGEVPVLSDLRLWWSPPNASATQSQLFHRDGADARQTKFFFNVRDVTADCGPFTFIPAAESEHIMRRLGRRHGRFTDQELEALGGLAKATALVGPAGAGACVDTSRCLHFGSRGNAIDRVVLMIQYTRARAPAADSPSWRDGIAPFWRELDPLQRLALNLRP